VSYPVSIFSTPVHVFGSPKGFGSRYHVLRSRTRFRRYRGRWVPFSCFTRPDLFLAEPRASAPIFMFCAPVLISHGTEGVGSHFHVLITQTRFRRYGGSRVPISCFARPDSFSAVSRASAAVFMFYSPEHVFGDIEGVGSRIHVLPVWTCFRRYGGRQLPFSCFALSDSFLALSKASVPVSMFCAPGLIFGNTEGVGSRFHILRSRTYSRRYRGRRVPFSCFACPDSFSALPRVSVPFLMFCAPEIIFGGIEGVGSRFHILRSLTYFRRYRGRRVTFSCFARSNSFSAVPRVSGPVFIFCAP
jgi:hypothetical protein